MIRRNRFRLTMAVIITLGAVALSGIAALVMLLLASGPATRALDIFLDTVVTAVLLWATLMFLVPHL
jgi:hypothetical protein